MVAITQRQLRNDSAAIMDRVEAGETLTLTRRGRAIAEVRPISGKRVSVPTDELLAAFAGLAPIDYARMREEADTAFGDGGDRIG